MPPTVSRPGRPPDLAGRKRKEALVTAWRVFSSLGTGVLADRAGVSVAGWYALVHPDRAHQPSAGVLESVAVALGEYASRLTAEADRLERVAHETASRRADVSAPRPPRRKRRDP